MSRSYKHSPVHKCSKPKVNYKRIYNKRVRRIPIDELPDGNYYKRLYPREDIYDPERCSLIYRYGSFRMVDFVFWYGEQKDEDEVTNEWLLKKWYRCK